MGGCGMQEYNIVNATSEQAAKDGALVFSVIARCFDLISETDWNELTATASWNAFLAATERCLLAQHANCPLQECVATVAAHTKARALDAVPSFGEKCAFAARHLTESQARSLARPLSHLAFELDLLASLLRNNLTNQAAAFLEERFAWLHLYRAKLLELGDDAWFYRGLVEILLEIRERSKESCQNPSR
jgi:hypothetical protein